MFFQKFVGVTLFSRLPGSVICWLVLVGFPGAEEPFRLKPDRVYLKPDMVYSGQHRQDHLHRLGALAPGYNAFVLQAIDRVQASAPDGGGYFTGVRAVPPESPIGYPLSLFGKSLLDPPRPTSYCSGSSYAVLVEALNRIYPQGLQISPERFEALRMQEPDGSRREDCVKAWGWWNADGYGCHYCLVQYLGMAQEVPPEEARPGDFLNINWKTGTGHSVVFLGYSRDSERRLQVNYFSSQASTGGLADHTVLAEKIQNVKFVRLTTPQNLSRFDPGSPVHRQVAPDFLSEHSLETQILEVPDVRQSTAYSCGAAAVQAILSYYGIDRREADLMQKLCTHPDRGTSPEAISRFLTSLGFEVEIHQESSLEDLQSELQKGRPVIVDGQAWREGAELRLPWSQVWESGHYMIAVGLDSHYLYLEDPSLLGQRGKIARSEWLERWHDYEIDELGQRKDYHRCAIFVRGKQPPAKPAWQKIP